MKPPPASTSSLNCTPNPGHRWWGGASSTRRTGRPRLARPDFELALALGEQSTEAKLEVLGREEAILSNKTTRFSVGRKITEFDPALAEGHVRFAELLARDGVPGRALDVLERAVRRFGKRADLLIPLAKHYCDFGLPREAEACYRTVLATEQGNIDARIGLQQCLELQRVPD